MTGGSDDGGAAAVRDLIEQLRRHPGQHSSPAMSPCSPPGSAWPGYSSTTAAASCSGSSEVEGSTRRRSSSAPSPTSTRRCSFTVLAGITEFFGGIAVGVGIFGRIAAVSLLGDMVMAMATVTWGNGIVYHYAPGGGYQLNVALASLAVVIALMGTGRLSLDEAGRLLVTRHSAPKDPPVTCQPDGPIRLIARSASTTPAPAHVEPPRLPPRRLRTARAEREPPPPRSPAPGARLGPAVRPAKPPCWLGWLAVAAVSRIPRSGGRPHLGGAPPCGPLRGPGAPRAGHPTSRPLRSAGRPVQPGGFSRSRAGGVLLPGAVRADPRAGGPRPLPRGGGDQRCSPDHHGRLPLASLRSPGRLVGGGGARSLLLLPSGRHACENRGIPTCSRARGALRGAVGRRDDWLIRRRASGPWSLAPLRSRRISPPQVSWSSCRLILAAWMAQICTGRRARAPSNPAGRWLGPPGMLRAALALWAHLARAS